MPLQGARRLWVCPTEREPVKRHAHVFTGCKQEDVLKEAAARLRRLAP